MSPVFLNDKAGHVAPHSKGFSILRSTVFENGKNFKYKKFSSIIRFHIPRIIYYYTPFISLSTDSTDTIETTQIEKETQLNLMI